MSEIRWCDPGGHPFSLNDPDRKEYASTEVVRNERGHETRERIDVCGPCTKSNIMGITSLGMGGQKAVGNGDTKEDPEE